MEWFPPNAHIDFMRYRLPVVGTSSLLVVLSLLALFWPGPRYGTDFAGGTELQLAFRGEVKSAELRQTLEQLGYARPDVVSVEGKASEYIVRVGEVSAITAQQEAKLRRAFESAIAGKAEVRRWKVSPGGDKLSVELSARVDDALLKQGTEAGGVKVRSVTTLTSAESHPYEVYLVGIADKIVRELGEKLGQRGPETPRRVEWVGPKAGQQLRDAAVKSILYAIAFIMVYIAFRFDLRFAPGGVVAMLHDVAITLGIYIVVQKEVNLTTVAALLTILGYSINDTIVVYDRIRENMGRMRGRTLSDIINVSTSQTLSRTIMTSGTTLISVLAFFIWGTPMIQDITFALFCGILVGTYSSIYVAAPVTEWMDRRFFAKAA